jgi:hypothetical protein
MISAKDKEQLAQKGISEEKLNEQLNCFKTGFPYLKLYAAASVDEGILKLTEEEQQAFAEAWDEAAKSLHIVKFVPASGAASRMFKDLFSFSEANYDVPTTDFEKTFFNNLEHYAFFCALDAQCKTLHNKGCKELLKEGEYKKIVNALLQKEGLNYGQLPKGLLLFHRYEDSVRTPAEEHLVEGALYAKEDDGTVNVHFTVSPEHRSLFEAHIKENVPALEEKFGVKYNISFSEQKSSTDTVAATPNNEPFRLDDGSLLFRPAGHGALIENLNDIAADILFIKNIDNVVPDRLKPETVHNKKMLAGILVSLQKKTFNYLHLLESGQYSPIDLQEIKLFLEKELCCKTLLPLEGKALADYLYQKLNRPMRVCGMVPNVGEPGGGPFLVYNQDGSISLQILESSQINMDDEKSKAMFVKGTHFNPVDLVCAVKNYKGEKFNLPDFVDKNTGFISLKSKNGRELKALELPGLWNGAMSDWNTVFVEVPLITFNPVKTVNDLIREQHQ